MDSRQGTMGSALGAGRRALSEEVPAGYKRTEVGVIPEEWECGRLGDLTTRVGSGITPSGGERVYVTEGRPFLRSQNVGWGALDLADLAFISDELHASFATSELEEGDVLLNITGASIGRSAVADITVARGNVNQHVCEIRTDPKRLDPHFLNSYLLSAAGQRQIDSYQAGGNRQGLNYGQIRSFLIPRPILSEQRAIAEALSDVDELLVALEALIAKKRAVKQAAMQQLLTGKTRLPGFSGAWTEKSLRDLVTITMGQSPPSISYNLRGEGLPLIQGNADIADRQTLERVWTTQVSKRCDSGDLLLTVRAPVGTVAVARKAACLGRGVCGLKPIGSSAFLFHALVHAEDRWRILEQGSTFTAANSKQIGQFCLPVPTDENEQHAIATILSDMDTEIAALERRRDKTRAVKQGMMQQLLTGRVRLIELDSDGKN